MSQCVAHLQLPEAGNASGVPLSFCMHLLGLLLWFWLAPDVPARLLLCCRASRAASSCPEAEAAVPGTACPGLCFVLASLVSSASSSWFFRLLCGSKPTGTISAASTPPAYCIMACDRAGLSGKLCRESMQLWFLWDSRPACRIDWSPFMPIATAGNVTYLQKPQCIASNSARES